MELSAKTVIAFEGQLNLHRIIYVDSEPDEAFTIHVFDKTAQPVFQGYKELKTLVEKGIVPIVPDPFAFLHFLNLTDAQREHRDAHFGDIRDLVENHLYELLFRDSRGRFIDELCKMLDKAESIIRRDIRRYLQRGMTPNAVCNDYRNCGAKGQIRITSEKEQNFTKKLGRPSTLTLATGQITGTNTSPGFQKIILLSYGRFVRGRKMPLKRAYDQMLLNFFFRKPPTSKGNEDFCAIPIPSPEFRKWVEQLPFPSWHQFYYWATKERMREDGKPTARGRDLYRRAFRKAQWPSQKYQMDAWFIDSYVVDPNDRSKILGRPILYVVIDVYSYMIVGIFVTLRPPSWECAKIALHNAMTSKVTYCAQFGIQIDPEDWPSEATPDTIYADKGETDIKEADPVIEGLGIHFMNGPAFQPDLRGLVEGVFNLIKINVIGPLPPTINNPDRPARRRGHDYRLDAELTLTELTRIIIHFVIKHNNFHEVVDGNEREPAMLTDQVKPTPVDLWNWGVENKAGGLRCDSAEIVKANLLPRAKLSVSRQGLKLVYGKGSGLHYTCENEFELRKRFRGDHLSVGYDPELVDEIYLIPNSDFPPNYQNHLLTLKLHENSLTYQGFSFEEYDLAQQVLKVESSLLKKQRLVAQIHQLIMQKRIHSLARKLTEKDKQGKSDRERLAQIVLLRKAARLAEKAEHDSILNPSSSQLPSNADHPQPEQFIVSTSTPQTEGEYVGSGYMKNLRRNSKA